MIPYFLALIVKTAFIHQLLHLVQCFVSLIPAAPTWGQQNPTNHLLPLRGRQGKVAHLHSWVLISSSRTWLMWWSFRWFQVHFNTYVAKSQLAPLFASFLSNQTAYLIWLRLCLFCIRCVHFPRRWTANSLAAQSIPRTEHKTQITFICSWFEVVIRRLQATFSPNEWRTFICLTATPLFN